MIHFKNIKKRWKIKLAVGTGIFVFALAGGIIGFRSYSNAGKTSFASQNTADLDVGKTILNDEQKKVLEEIKETYNEENQAKIAQEMEKEKQSGDYTQDHMLIKYNPYGTNTQSLYVYFKTEDAASVSYTIHVENDKIDDFSKNVYQEKNYQTEHEFQIIGLIPDTENEVTITIKKSNGTVEKKNFSYHMGSLLGTEDIQLDKTSGSSSQELADGLYVVMGNDSDALDFMYYYDNQGVLRGEVPIIGYRSHRLLFDDDGMYYSISQTKIARVNRFGQVTKVYSTGDYNLHHDYVFDDDGNILTLATDTNSESVEDRVLRINKDTKEVTEVLDMEDLLGDYKEKCEKASDGDLDWMHLNTIQWLGDGEILLSSRETSTIFKIDDLHDTPSIGYMIGPEEIWKDTEEKSLLLTKKGDFTIQGGQHTVTYVEDEDLGNRQYYVYMFNNNIGISESQPNVSWGSIGLTNDEGSNGDSSYYYKYFVDEEKGTFALTDSFKVPYSGYVSSAQEIDGNTVIDSGIAGTFGEYDSSHTLIKSFKMEVERFIYRVYKYDFEEFYFT